ncbi:PilN domain-containing protein [bacterium]|nr:PilN domain-containing protein [bacterium]
MKQQIDFFKSEPKKPIELPAKWITLAVIGSLVLCMLISLYMAVSTIKNNEVVKRELANSISATTLFQHAVKTYPLLAGEQSLDDQITALKQDLQTKKNDYEILTHTALRYGFSNYLQALATLVPEGLWLTDINLNQATNNATLGGYMMNPVSLPKLLQGLQYTQTFEKFKFHLFYFKQVKDKAYAQFKLANTTLIEGQKM